MKDKIIEILVDCTSPISGNIKITDYPLIATQIEQLHSQQIDEVIEATIKAVCMYIPLCELSIGMKNAIKQEVKSKLKQL